MPENSAKKTGAAFTPPVAADAAVAVGRDAFLLKGEHVDAWFVRRSPVLFVTFDNLASVGEYDPPQPWLHVRAERDGASILGLISRRKDWYRNPDAASHLTALKAAGFFDGWERIVFTGASMGGYAALTFSRIVSGSVVLAFSPQTTLSREIAPFETRYRYAHRKWDWDSPRYLDAAEAVGAAERVLLFYDPMVPEDRAHASRMVARNVEHLKCRHFGHRAIRILKECGVLDDIFRDVAQGNFDRGRFYRSLRVRRDVPVWRKTLVQDLEAAGRAPAALRLADWFEGRYGKARFIRRLRERHEGEEASDEGESGTRVEGAADKGVIAEFRIGDGAADGPFEGRILHLSRALVVPDREHDARHASGVLHADGSYADLSRAWIRARKAMPEPTLTKDEKITRLPGRHLFAGHIRGHFGHFLVESTARLWAYGALEGKLDGVLYLPYRGPLGPAARAIDAYRDFFDQLGITVPIRAADGVMEVEELYLPELGFGWLDRYAGSPEYRLFMRGRLGKDVTPEGKEKLYVSRARLPSQRGGILGETVIEQNLARQGYEIFHPEKHDLRTQIARYKAARQIVALDGSALHLAAYFMDDKCRVGMILRRSNANADDYILQYHSFCGFTPDVFDAIDREWVSGDATRVDFRSVGQLDFARLFGLLASAGYVEPDFKPDLPSEEALGEMLREFAERRGDEFAPVGHEEEAD